MSSAQQALHTIFGAGQVGRKLAAELLARGHRVRLVRRGPAGPAQPGLTWMSGDLSDQAFADEAARGAAVVYHCANPADYANWHGVLEPLARSIRGAAARAGARLVVLDCLYMIGKPPRSPFDEDTAMNPCTPKGELRAMLAEELFAAHRSGEVEVSCGRASDFFGPETPLSMIFHPRSLERLQAGKRVELFGDPDMPHGYSYTPDVARGLAELGTRPEAAGRLFHLPVAWTGSSRELVARAGALLGKPGEVRAVPGWLMDAAGWFSPLARAMREMDYQWRVPYVIDDRRFRETFGWGATPIDQALADTLGLERAAAAA
ncbi:MAG: NAD-dependent epimerase/dehydratase family protein [Myxococcales bacterium]|nr:NAD-dependent epimerase/dehydratase family protein [Myxococcales bacterium]